MHEQTIYFGAPGTGKSYIIYDKLSSVPSKKKIRVTIHPEYMYSDFVGQLLPDKSSGTLDFTFKKGPFTIALIEAFSNRNEEVYLILEELSRGNVAAIFGDLFQLLDRDDHFNSKYPIYNADVAAHIPSLTTNDIYLPSNLNILCTVNLNDQNVFPMDTAFKRRFSWEYVSTEPVIDNTTGLRNTKLNNPRFFVAIDSNRSNDIDTTWHAFYMALNQFITDKQNGLGKKEDKQIGQFFIDFGTTITTNSHSSDPAISLAARESIDHIVRNKLLMYLWQDVQSSVSSSNSKSIFAPSINNYDSLYKTYGNDKVFSDDFINTFLQPVASAYPY